MYVGRYLINTSTVFWIVFMQTITTLQKSIKFLMLKKINRNKSSQISKSLNLTNLHVHLDFSLPFQMLQEVQCLSHGKFIHNSHENNLASILTSRCHKVTFAINHKLGRLLRKKLCTYKNWSRPSKINYMVLVLVVSCWFMWFLLFIYFSSCLCGTVPC